MQNVLCSPPFLHSFFTLQRQYRTLPIAIKGLFPWWSTVVSNAWGRKSYQYNKYKACCQFFHHVGHECVQSVHRLSYIISWHKMTLDQNLVPNEWYFHWHSQRGLAHTLAQAKCYTEFEYFFELNTIHKWMLGLIDLGFVQYCSIHASKIPSS